MVEEGGELTDMYATKLRDAQQAVFEMHGFVERFELRLGRGHEVPDAFSNWQRMMEEPL